MIRICLICICFLAVGLWFLLGSGALAVTQGICSWAFVGIVLVNRNVRWSLAKIAIPTMIFSMVMGMLSAEELSTRLLIIEYDRSHPGMHRWVSASTWIIFCQTLSVKLALQCIG
jgi:vacuolar-type H+-ATPase subunit I/STV1